MKQSIIRLCCAVVLMGLALTASVAMIGAVREPADQQETFVWAKILISTQTQSEEIRLFSADGKLAQTLHTDRDGQVVSGLMVPGKYYAVTQWGCTEFRLHANASVTAEGGCGWVDGEVLHLTSGQVGKVTVERVAENGDWLDYVLKGPGTERREVVRCKEAGELVQCTFEGLPYGTYVLQENGVERCKVNVGADEADVTVSLP